MKSQRIVDQQHSSRANVTGAVVLISLLGLLMPPAAASEVPAFFTKELTNTSNQGVDGLVAALLHLPETELLGHFDGEAGAKFDSFSSLSVEDSEIDLTWGDFNDGANNLLDVGDTVIISWLTSTPTDVTSFFWTVGFGGGCGTCNIFQAGVLEVGPNPGIPSPPPSPRVTLINGTVPPGGAGQNITVDNVEYAIFAAPIDLSALNSNNSVLAAALIPLTSTPAVLVPDATLVLDLPPAAEGSYVVLKYDVTSAGSGARIRDYLQFQFVPAVPAISGPGVVILGLAILAGGLMLRRRLG